MNIELDGYENFGECELSLRIFHVLCQYQTTLFSHFLILVFHLKFLLVLLEKQAGLH